MGSSFSSSTIGSNSPTTNSILHRILKNVTVGQAYTKITFEGAAEEFLAADIIPMDELIAMNAEWRDSHSKAFGILRSTSAITSVISSSIFIWMIMRSHDHLSTTQHRLFLGLCISDIILSSSFSFFNVMVPSDNDYFVWNARGNQHTCNTQGFFAGLGIFGGLFYNAALNLYFLAIVKYKKSDKFIRTKIEPFLHGVPIVMAFSYSIYRLVKKQLNGDDHTGSCVSPIHNAPHCVGYGVGEIREGFDIPCWRGNEGVVAAFISTMVLMSIPILIMMVSLGMIYSAVRTQEKKLARYGIGALGSMQSTSSILQQRAVQDEQSGGLWRSMTMSLTALSASIKTMAWRNSTNEPITRSNSGKQIQSRAVMHKAFGYSFAWFLSWGFYIIGTIIKLATGSFPLVLIYLVTIFCPLQGLFNLLIFMHPRIMTAKMSKRRGETVSWCKAFNIAFWSRGKDRKNQGTRMSNLRGRSNRHSSQRTINEDTVVDNAQSPTFGRIKKKKKRADTPQEEEKCEIQVPDNLNPSKTKAMYSAASTATYERNIAPSSTENTIQPRTL